MKKGISLFLVLIIMASCVFSINVCAADDIILTEKYEDSGDGKITANYNTITNELIFDGYGKHLIEMNFSNLKYNVTKVKSIRINEGITVFGIKFFVSSDKDDASSLKEITIPKSIKRILAGTIDSASNLEVINYAGTKEEWEKVIIEPDNEPLTKCKNIKFDVEVPVSESAEDYVDDRYKEVVSKTDNYRLKLDYYTGDLFVSPYKGTVLKWIDNPEWSWGALKYYDAFGFDGDKLCNTLYVADGVTKIEDEMLSGFYDVEMGESIHIPKSVKYIGGHNATGEENEIPDVYYEGSRTEWEKIEFGTGGLTNKFSDYGTDERNVIKVANVHYAVRTKGDNKADVPKLNSIKNKYEGILVKWESSFGASNGYRVYRKTSGTGWKYLDTVYGSGYLDKDVMNKTGTVYTYTARAVAEDGTRSSYEKGVSLKRVEAPKIKIAGNTTKGIKITWNKVKGADSYRVYRLTTDGWDYLKTVKGTSFIDTDVNNGWDYYYTVRAVDGKTLGAYNDGGVRYYYVETPKITKIINANSGVRIDWTKNKAAGSYNVYRKTSSSGWKIIGKTEKTYFVDKTAKKGVKYTYTVRANKYGTLSSFYSGKTIVRLETPKIKSVSSDNGKVTFKYGKVAGVTSYVIYRKIDSGDFSKIATTKSTTYIDKKVKKGRVYTYTVRALGANSSKSHYDTSGRNVVVK